MFGTRLRRCAPVVGCALALGVLAGCGGASASGGGIPADASVKDFCKAGTAFAAVSQFDAGVKAANTLRDTGTPKGIPADARDGFELVVRMITQSKDATDLERRFKALTATQKKSVESLDAYIAKTC